MAGPKVELYQEGTVQRQIAQEPLMGRVDTGAQYEAQAVNSLIQSGASIAKTVSENHMREETLRAKELFVQAREQLQERQSGHLSLTGQEALNDERGFRDDIMGIVSSTREAAKGELSEFNQRGLDVQLHEMVIAARGVSANKISQEQKRVEASLNKQIAEGANDAGFSVGQALSGATGNRWEGLLGMIDSGAEAAAESKIALLKTTGEYSPDTEDAIREKARSSYGLMVIKGAANDSGAEGAKSALDLLKKKEIGLVSGDAEQAKKLIASLERSEKEDDRNTRIGNGTAYLMQFTDSASMQKAAKELDPDIRNQALSAARAQFNDIKKEEAANASAAYDELNRYLSQNPTATLGQLAQEKPDAWEAVKDNKMYVEGLRNRNDIATNMVFYSDIMSLSREELIARFQKGERERTDDEGNSFYAEINRNTNAADAHALIKYVNAQTAREGSLSVKDQIETDFMRSINQQSRDRIEQMFGESYGGLSPANQQKADMIYRSVFARVGYELDELQKKGLPRSLSNTEFSKIWDEFAHTVFEKNLIFSDVTVRSIPAPQQQALQNFYRNQGGKPEDLAPTFEKYGVKLPPEDLAYLAPALKNGGDYEDLKPLMKEGFSAKWIQVVSDVAKKNGVRVTAKDLKALYFTKGNKEKLDPLMEQM